MVGAEGSSSRHYQNHQHAKRDGKDLGSPPDRSPHNINNNNNNNNNSTTTATTPRIKKESSASPSMNRKPSGTFSDMLDLKAMGKKNKDSKESTDKKGNKEKKDKEKKLKQKSPKAL